MTNRAEPAAPSPAELTHLLKESAARLGFVACGITTADPFPETEAAMRARLDAGMLDGMPWFTHARAHLACAPQELLPGARSLAVLAAPYPTGGPTPAEDGPRGIVSRYARGLDYHDVVKERLSQLADTLELALGRRVQRRLFVDSAPLAERAAAQRAGVGWFGKNTMILLPGVGSYVFLCALLLDVELPADEPLRKSCGSCDRCLRACPTGALPAPYVLDATRCISYLTIEHRGAIPEDLRPLMGDRVFGCDICQEVCPVNHRDGPLGWPEFSDGTAPGAPSLAAWLEWTAEEYQHTLKGSPLKRAKLRGLKRNAAIAAGNTGDTAAVASLVVALQADDPLVRGHAAWALGEIGGSAALAALRTALAEERDPVATAEIRAALENLGRPADET